jgi:FixJ family two-component response regulator
VLGGKDTFELLRSINPHCRIVIVTGYGRGVIETSKFPGGVNGFMQKPFQIETLAAKVREVLDRKIPQPEQTTDQS